MENDMARERRRAQILGKRGFFGRAREVMERERPRAGLRKMAQHRHDRRDANATGDEQETACLGRKHEVVAGLRARHDRALGASIDKARRAATTGCLALDGDDVAVALVAVVAQRVLAQHAARRLDRDVRARRELGQLAVVRGVQLERLDAAGKRCCARHHQRHQCRVAFIHRFMASVVIPQKSRRLARIYLDA